ncbi:MAG: LysR family transcriptional regulator [Hyphomonadaceae bacterium]
MDRLDVLKTFVAVADRRSFAEAARHLLISPAAASRAIAALEDELGVAVFRRTTRTVALTDAGAAYLERCRHALAELEDAGRTVRGETANPHGGLTVTAPVVFGRMHIAPVLADLLRQHNRLKVTLMLTDRNVHVIEEGIDVAVRIGELSDSSLIARQVTEVRHVLVASPDYISAHTVPQSPAELKAHSLVGLDSMTPNGEWRFERSRAKPVRIEPRLQTNDVATAIDAAVRGLGIARLLSYQVFDHIAAGRLVRVLDDFAPSPVPVTLLHPATRQTSPSVRALVDAASLYFRRTGSLK